MTTEELGAMTGQVVNTADVIDSREVIERLGELAAQWTNWCNAREGEPLTDEERAELDALSALAKDASDYADDWEYGVPLVRDSYFQEYAGELAEDLGVMQHRVQWPFTCIDWAQAARELRMDYTPVEFGGVTYWVR